MAERIDWTKRLVPRVNRNADGYVADYAPDSLNTTDLVSLPSLAELKALNIPFPETTDFAHLSNERLSQVSDAPVDLLLTRTPSSRSAMYCLSRSGEVGDKYFADSGLGVTPSISVQLPPHYTLSQLAKEFGLTKASNGLYQVQLGEYPQTKLAGTPDKSKRCTGRWYTSFVQTAHGVVSRQNPEYEDQNGKYVWFAAHTDQWYKVEPLTWWVENSAAVANKTATQLDLTCSKMIMSNVPFNQLVTSNFQFALDVNFWQNSLMRAFLNSADLQTLDGNPMAKFAYLLWNHTQGGFLQQALNMTREPTREYTIPTGEAAIAPRAFRGCKGLEKLVIPGHVQRIDYEPFRDCPQLRLQIALQRSSDLEVYVTAFQSANLKYLYVPRDPNGQWLWVSPKKESALLKDYFLTELTPDRLKRLFDENYRRNFIQLQHWREQGKIKFMPPDFTLATFPASEMSNYFVNNNHKRWAELVKALNFDLLAEHEKTNSLTDLMKLYYALGGFAAHQGAREKAFSAVRGLVTSLLIWTLKGAEPSPRSVAVWLGEEIHGRFSRLALKGPYNPTFAEFFMKYSHSDPDFMRFELPNLPEQDYFCAAHNAFNRILQYYPNRVINGNMGRDLLTPRFVAERCRFMQYDNVEAQNTALAEMVGSYGYTQEQFNKMQIIYNQAKIIKDQAVIRLDNTEAEGEVSYRVLSKDDPLGFVIGDITNCCQHIGGIAESCLVDGYTNPNAGFLVFEAKARNANGTPTGEKRILGQAYVWYDPHTKTVCYDNIEVPRKIMAELKNGGKHHQALSVDSFLQAVTDSADAIMTTMNQNGIKVKRVTVGEGYNDLREWLDTCFYLDAKPARHRNYQGYTDARQQYLIRTYCPTHTKLTTAQVGGTKRGLKAKLTALDISREI